MDLGTLRANVGSRFSNLAHIPKTTPRHDERSGFPSVDPRKTTTYNYPLEKSITVDPLAGQRLLTDHYDVDLSVMCNSVKSSAKKGAIWAANLAIDGDIGSAIVTGSGDVLFKIQFLKDDNDEIRWDLLNISKKCVAHMDNPYDHTLAMDYFNREGSIGVAVYDEDSCDVGITFSNTIRLTGNKPSSHIFVPKKDCNNQDNMSRNNLVIAISAGTVVLGTLVSVIAASRILQRLNHARVELGLSLIHI